MSPLTFSALFEPRYHRLIDLVKSKTQAKVCLHTCGATYWIRQNPVDVGMDVVHLLQPTALRNDDALRIKREFGDRLTFVGGLR